MYVCPGLFVLCVIFFHIASNCLFIHIVKSEIFFQLPCKKIGSSFFLLPEILNLISSRSEKPGAINCIDGEYDSDPTLFNCVPTAGTMNYLKKTGLNLYQSRHCSYITYCVKNSLCTNREWVNQKWWFLPVFQPRQGTNKNRKCVFTDKIVIQWAPLGKPQK